MCGYLEDFLFGPSASIYSRDLLEKLQLENNYTLISTETRPCDMCGYLEDFLFGPSASIYSRDLLEKL